MTFKTFELNDSDYVSDRNKDLEVLDLHTIHASAKAHRASKLARDKAKRDINAEWK